MDSELKDSYKLHLMNLTGGAGPEPPERAGCKQDHLDNKTGVQLGHDSNSTALGRLASAPGMSCMDLMDHETVYTCTWHKLTSLHILGV